MPTPEEELGYVRRLLLGMVTQYLKTRSGDKTYLFSGFIAINAEAMAYLGECGLLEVTNDNKGRVVEAKIPEGDL